MAPKSALSTPGTDNLQEKRTPARPLTTAGKIAKAHANTSKLKKPAVSEPPPGGTGTSAVAKGKPKLYSLPHPDEQRAQPASLSKKIKKPSPVMTTQKKIALHQAKTRAKEDERAGLKGKADATGRIKIGERANNVKPPSTFSIIMNQDATARRFKGKDERPAVMTRTTKRAELWKRQHPDLVDTHRDGKLLRIMDLPAELRGRIWELVVVEEEVFVWPNQPTGQEQPDLAMVSREIRAEVLPIFYGQNRFAVELCQDWQSNFKRGGRTPMTDLVALQKWSTAIEKHDHFRPIRKWAFDYTPGSSHVVPMKEVSGFLISFRFSAGTDRKANVEVHRAAACVLPGCQGYGACKVHDLPAWLSEAASKVSESAGTNGVNGKAVVQLARTIKVRGRELAVHACEAVIKSVEI